MTVTHLFIDSNNREGKYSNEYTVYLTKDLKNITQVELVHASVPNVVYNITDGIDCVSVGSTLYSIPNGFYSAYQLATQLTASVPLTCQYIPEQNKFRFSNTSAFTMTFNNQEIQKRLGFETSDEYVSVNNVVQSEKNADFSTSQFVFLDIDEFRIDSLIDTKSNRNFPGTTVTRFFAPIPMDVEPAYLKTFSENKDFKYSVTYTTPIHRLSRLTVKWTDANGIPLNFDGAERNSFLLRIHTLDSNVTELVPKVNESKVPYYVGIAVVLFLVFLLVSF